MLAALIVARELLRCRLAENGRDALLERVAELLDCACRCEPPFYSLSMPQVVAEVRVRPRRARAPPGAMEEPDDTNIGTGVAHPTAATSSQAGASAGGLLQARAGVQPGGR